MYSKRHLRRLNKEIKDKYAEKLNRASEETVSCSEIEKVEGRQIGEEIEDNEKLESDIEIINVASDNKVSLSEDLKEWFLKHRTTRECAVDLVRVLKRNNLQVAPFHKYTAQKNPDIAKIDGGLYLHIGLKTQLSKLFYILKLEESLCFDINIDGLPLYKSSNAQLWPILIRLVNVKNAPILPIGIFLGKSKPTCCDEFLRKFTCELQDLLQNGVELGNKLIKISIRAIVCDAPARAFISGTPGHTSSHGCSKCTQVARKLNGTLTFKTDCGILITDNDFTNRIYPEQHSQKYLTKMTALESVNVKMVTQIPLDCMHLIDLGVMRKFLVRIITNKICVKIAKPNIMNMSNKLISLLRNIPKEFVRKPRPLNELLKWKATEFRQFLLYTGIFVFKNELSEDQYYVFLLLHCAYRLLCFPKLRGSNLDISQGMLDNFVDNFPLVFGDNSVSYNIHSLLHVKDTIQQVGDPVEGSSYAFENYLQLLKRHVRKPTKILEQIYRKIDEERFTPSSLDSEPKIANKVITFKGCKLTENAPNNYCYVDGGIPIFIVSILEDFDRAVIGRRLINLRNFYDEPIPSSSLGIYLV
uniref:Transposase domain-containing protein n=1 Tax=Drosophila pseudoobscura TaxID=7237 RepID=A0JPR8_9MUSC|nr:TPA: transposase domain-containing protein [Drosophila pseudoobscura]